MKIFANKSIWKKLIILFLVINLFTFIAPKPVAAGIGGELANPIITFVVSIRRWGCQYYTKSCYGH